MMSYELERIEELCRERGWSHYRLALEMDTSPNNIGNLFRRTTVSQYTTITAYLRSHGDNHGPVLQHRRHTGYPERTAEADYGPV